MLSGWPPCAPKWPSICWGPRRIPDALFALALILALASNEAAAANRYEEALRGRTLVEGLGFESVLTVFDETPRMFKRLGQPIEKPGMPLWYFYEDGRFRVVVRAGYADGRFRVHSIQYAGDSQKSIATNLGTRLGDSRRKVISSHGEPWVASKTEMAYPTRGVTFQLDGDQTVIGIEVYRPREKPPGDRSATPAPPPESGPAVPGLVDLGLEIPTPSGWVLSGDPTFEHLSFRGDGGAVEMEVRACAACGGEIGERVRAFESGRKGENGVPLKLRDVDRPWLARMGAESGYVGVYGSDGATREWLVALRQGRRAWMITVRLHADRPLSQAVLRDLAAVLRGIRILGGGSP